MPNFPKIPKIILRKFSDHLCTGEIIIKQNPSIWNNKNSRKISGRILRIIRRQEKFSFGDFENNKSPPQAKFFRGVLGIYQGGNGNFVQKTASGELKFGAILKNNKNSEIFCCEKFGIIKTLEKFRFWASEKILKGSSHSAAKSLENPKMSGNPGFSNFNIFAPTWSYTMFLGTTSTPRDLSIPGGVFSKFMMVGYPYLVPDFREKSFKIVFFVKSIFFEHCILDFFLNMNRRIKKTSRKSTFRNNFWFQLKFQKIIKICRETRADLVDRYSTHVSWVPVSQHCESFL